MIRPMPMTGFMVFMISSSWDSGIMLATTVEYAMPSSRKLSTGVGSRLLTKKPTPAVASSVTISMISEVRGVCMRRSSRPETKPVTMPISTGRNTRNSTTPTGMPAVEMCADTSAITVKNTSAPTRSSSAAIGIRVLVTGPLVCISLTMESEGAGAVASAMPPNMNAG